MRNRTSLLDELDLSGLPNDWSVHAPDQGHPLTITPPGEDGSDWRNCDTYISIHYSPADETGDVVTVEYVRDDVEQYRESHVPGDEAVQFASMWASNY